MAAGNRRTRRGRGAHRRPGRPAAALNAYFDTSALVKLLVREEGSGVARELWARATLRIASRLAYPEARAALAAAERAGRIDARSLRSAVADLGHAHDAMRVIGIDDELARRAGELAEHEALRAYDAVHLATALAIDDPELVLVTWDRDLADAAARRGRLVSPPRAP